MRPNDWDDSYDVTGKRVAVIGTGSSGVQIAAALSDSVASLDVYQRTPAWVLPKVDFDIPPVMRTIFRVPGSVRAVNALGRWVMDAAMLAPLFHVFNRLPDRVLVAAMPLLRPLEPVPVPAAAAGHGRRPGHPPGAAAALRHHGQATGHLECVPAGLQPALHESDHHAHSAHHRHGSGDRRRRRCIRPT